MTAGAIELRERLIGPGLVGSMDFDPMRRAFVDAAERTATAVHDVGRRLESIGWGVHDLSNSLIAFESSIAVRLDAQARTLNDQLNVLASIDATLRTPAKTRAAERLVDAGGLLRTRRYDRALTCANEAIDGDPNNPGGFAAAGWAYLGLGRDLEAARHFEEACIAAQGYEPWLDYIRLAARCYVVAGRADHGRELLEHALRHVESVKGADSRDGAGLQYEAALASVQLGDLPSAESHLMAAVDLHTDYAKAALAEPLFEAHPSLAARALSKAEEIVEGVIEKQERLEREAQELAVHLERLLPLTERCEEVVAAIPPRAPASMKAPRDLERFHEHRQAVIDLTDEILRRIPVLDVDQATIEAQLDEAWVALRRLQDFSANYNRIPPAPAQRKRGWFG